MSTAKKIKIIKVKPKAEQSKGPEPATPTETLENDLNQVLDQVEAKSDDSFN